MEQNLKNEIESKLKASMSDLKKKIKGTEKQLSAYKKEHKSIEKAITLIMGKEKVKQDGNKHTQS